MGTKLAINGRPGIIHPKGRKESILLSRIMRSSSVLNPKENFEKVMNLLISSMGEGYKLKGSEKMAKGGEMSRNIWDRGLVCLFNTPTSLYLETLRLQL